MKVGEPGGHFDQMIRQTRSHHVMLSQVADHKANMLTTVSALACTFLLSFADPKSSYHIPATMMILTCVATCCFAVLASMPSLKRPKPLAKKRSPHFNPLFFGDFAGLSWEEYEHEMEHILESHENAYEAQLREIYAMGLYLANRKYRFLRRAYIALFTGLTASALVWLALQLSESGIFKML